MSWEDSKACTALKRDFLKSWFARERRYFLTGGSALGLFYLDHRRSYDLDLYFLEQAGHDLLAAIPDAKAKDGGWEPAMVSMLLDGLQSAELPAFLLRELEPGDLEAFKLDGRDAFVILPPGAGKDIPWVWYAPTLRGLPGKAETWMFERFLKAGIAIAGVDVGESYGSPDGRKIYSAFHEHLVEKRGFATKACLLARSRGGLMLYSWAAENPDKVNGVAGLDHRIGEILATLKAEKLDQNTIVVFLSDNGPQENQKAQAKPYRGLKWEALEGGTRVPCIIRFPGVIPAGRKSDALIAAIDLLPSLSHACGIDLDRQGGPCWATEAWEWCSQPARMRWSSISGTTRSGTSASRRTTGRRSEPSRRSSRRSGRSPPPSRSA